MARHTSASAPILALRRATGVYALAALLALVRPAGADTEREAADAETEAPSAAPLARDGRNHRIPAHCRRGETTECDGPVILCRVGGQLQASCGR